MTRTLVPTGDEVLVLLPTSTRKLHAQWQGPYKIKRKMGRVNYEVEMPGRRKDRRLLHINLLRKWHTPADVNYLTEVEDCGDLEEDIPSWNGGAEEAEQPVISNRLDSQQKTELGEILQEFSDVLKYVPGRTNLAEHRIETETSRPLRQPPYRLPHAHRDSVLTELGEMEASDIIEPSASEWAAPILVVPRRMGGYESAWTIDD